ncbi:EpsG family protein [Clostridium perfringens]
MIYYIIAGSMVFVSFIDILTNYRFEKKNKIYFYIFSIIIFLLAAIRRGIGYDYYHYYDIFEKINYGVPNELINIEPLYYYLNRVIDNFNFLIIIIAIIGVLIKSIIIYKFSYDKILSLLIYFTGIYMMYDIGVIRQGISLTFALISIPFILERKKIKFIICILIGFMFHKSIIVFFPLYFLNYKSLKRKTIYISSIFILFISFSGINKLICDLIKKLPIDFLQEKVAYYSIITTGNINISIVKRVLFLIIFFEFYKYLNLNNKLENIFLNGYFLSVLFMALFSYIPIIGGRGTASLYMLQIFIFSTIVYKLKNKRLKLIVFFTIVILSINGMVGQIRSGNELGQPYTPYVTIFSNE